MITPGEARDIEDALATALEARVDNAIRSCANGQHWPCTVALASYGNVADRVAAKYRDAGWRVEVVYDWRDGDFLRLKRP